MSRPRSDQRFKCKNCHRGYRSVCPRTGFRYDWCGGCYRKARRDEEDYIDEFSRFGSEDLTREDRLKAFRGDTYAKEMRTKKEAFLARRKVRLAAKRKLEEEGKISKS